MIRLDYRSIRGKEANSGESNTACLPANVRRKWQQLLNRRSVSVPCLNLCYMFGALSLNDFGSKWWSGYLWGTRPTRRCLLWCCQDMHAVSWQWCGYHHVVLRAWVSGSTCTSVLSSTQTPLALWVNMGSRQICTTVGYCEWEGEWYHTNCRFRMPVLRFCGEME